MVNSDVVIVEGNSPKILLLSFFSLDMNSMTVQSTVVVELT